MGYRELAVKIKNGYSSLKREPVFKCLDIIWNQKLKTAEISVVNDGLFIFYLHRVLECKIVFYINWLILISCQWVMLVFGHHI